MNILRNMPASQNILMLSIIICMITYFPGIFLIVFEQTTESPLVTIQSSSQIKGLGPEGLLNNAQPGWHAEKNPHYPQTITITFKNEKTLSEILIYPQDNHYNRAPNQVRINYKKNNKIWVKGDNIYNFPCLSPNSPNYSYTKIALHKPITTTKVQIEIINNCGDTEFLTLKGITTVQL